MLERSRIRIRLFMAVLAGALLTGIIIYGKGKEKDEMTNIEFFKSLDYSDGLEVAVKTLERFPLQYGTTLGLDGNPQIRPLEFKFEEDGVLYFDTVEFYSSYKEMQAHPTMQLCVCDQETMTYIRIGGTVNFTRDKKIIEKCFENSPVLTSQFGDNREVVVGYYLTDTWVEFNSFTEGLTPHRYHLQKEAS